MKKAELKDIIGMFQPKEFRRFGDYIRSPFFNVPERVAALYDFIENNYKAVKEEKITREEAASKILKGSRSPENIRKLFSDFNREAERFLSLAEYELDEDYRELALLKQLRKKSSQAGDNALHARFVQKLQEAEKQLHELKPDISSYRKAIDVYEQKLLAEPDTEFHNYSGALQMESDMLDAYYISSKLFMFQLMFSKQQLNKQPLGYRWDMYKEMSGFIEVNIETVKQKFPDIYIKHLMTKMAVTGDIELIGKYEEYLLTIEEALPREQLADYYSDLYNYITMQVGNGKHELRRPLMNLFMFLDSKQMLHDVPGGKIHTYTFKQAADTAFHLNELKWAEYFLGKYSGCVDSARRKDIVNLLYAKLHYSKNENSIARTRLAKVDYRDYIHYLDAKQMQLCIEYDEENFVEALLIIDSLEKYLKSHADIPESTAENTKSFLFYVKALLNLKENGPDDFLLSKLKEILTGDQRSVYAKTWLMEQIAGKVQ